MLVPLVSGDLRAEVAAPGVNSWVSSILLVPLPNPVCTSLYANPAVSLKRVPRVGKCAVPIWSYSKKPSPSVSAKEVLHLPSACEPAVLTAPCLYPSWSSLP